MTADVIPYADRDELLRWVREHPGEVTPVCMERLLSHHEFEEIGTMPTSGAARCVVWRHRKAPLDPIFAGFRVLIYHGQTVPERKVSTILALVTIVRRLAELP